MSSQETGPADMERPEAELAVELGEERLLLAALASRLAAVESFTKERSKGVTSRSRSEFSASRIMATTSPCPDHFTSLSPMPTR